MKRYKLKRLQKQLEDPSMLGSGCKCVRVVSNSDGIVQVNTSRGAARRLGIGPILIGTIPIVLETVKQAVEAAGVLS